MWGTFLSEPLPIVGLVGRYPANCLIGRIPSLHLIHLVTITCVTMTLSGVNLSFGRLSQCEGQVGYALRTHSPVVAQ